MSDPGATDVHVPAPMGGKKKKKLKKFMAAMMDFMGDALLEKGDVPGHDFHGNQFSAAVGGLKDGQSAHGEHDLSGRHVEVKRVAGDSYTVSVNRWSPGVHGPQAAPNIHSSVAHSKDEALQRAALHMPGQTLDRVKVIGKRAPALKEGDPCPSCKDAVIKDGMCSEKCGYEMAAKNDFSFVIPFNKVNEEQRLVTGWANVTDVMGTPVVDLQNDVISEATLVKAAHDFMSQTRAAKAMHEGPAIGEVVESMVLTKDLQKVLGIDLGHVGWLITMKISNDDVWKRVKSGELKAFSIGGGGKRKEID